MFWRTFKQEYIYLHPTDDVSALRKGIGDWIAFYNEQRPHQSLQGEPCKDVPKGCINRKNVCLTVEFLGGVYFFAKKNCIVQKKTLTLQRKMRDGSSI